jgi:hypothetical protein
VKAPSLTWPAFLCALLTSTAGADYSPAASPEPSTPRVERQTSAAPAAPTAPVERLRSIPHDAKKGAMWPPQGRRVRINDSIMTLAPGVTIRDMNNRIVQRSSIRRPKKIRYTLDMYGQVRRIWISPTGEYLGRHQPLQPPTLHD